MEVVLQTVVYSVAAFIGSHFLTVLFEAPYYARPFYWIGRGSVYALIAYEIIGDLLGMAWLEMLKFFNRVYRCLSTYFLNAIIQTVEDIYANTVDYFRVYIILDHAYNYVIYFYCTHEKEIVIGGFISISVVSVLILRYYSDWISHHAEKSMKLLETHQRKYF